MKKVAYVTTTGKKIFTNITENVDIVLCGPQEVHTPGSLRPVSIFCSNKVTGSITTSHPGQDTSSAQDSPHEVTWDITSFHWMGCKSITGYPPHLDGMLVHHRIPTPPGWDVGPIISLRMPGLLMVPVTYLSRVFGVRYERNRS